MAIGAFIAVWLARRQIRRVFSRLGLVHKRSTWEPHPTDPTLIIVEDVDATPVEAKLPKGVTSDQVVAAGIDRTTGVTVEVKHAPTNRTGRRRIDGSAADQLGGGASND